MVAKSRLPTIVPIHQYLLLKFISPSHSWRWPLFDIFLNMTEPRWHQILPPTPISPPFAPSSPRLHYGKIINICCADIRRSHACLNGPLFSHLWGSTSLFWDLWPRRQRMHPPAVSPRNYLFWFLWQQSFLLLPRHPINADDGACLSASAFSASIRLHVCL